MTNLAWLGISIGVFFAAMVYDIALARYVAAVAGRNARVAAGWSAITASVGLIGLISILKISPWLAVPEIFGYALGTYLAVARRS